MAEKFGPRSATNSWSAKFHEPGSFTVGRVLKMPEKIHSKNTKNEKRYWNDDPEQPMYEWIYTLQLIQESTCSPTCYWCRKSTPKTGEDPGIRKVYAKGKLHKVIQDAIYAVDNPETFGRLAIKYVRDDLEAKKPGQDAPKEWAAQYINPTPEDEKLASAALGETRSMSERETSGPDQNMTDLLNGTVGADVISEAAPQPASPPETEKETEAQRMNMDDMLSAFSGDKPPY